MAQTVFIKLTKASPKSGPFNISDNFGNVLGTNIPLSVLIDGVVYSVGDDVTVIVIES
jgi:hypothetical protein